MKLKNNTLFVLISICSLFVLSILILDAKENSRLILKGKEVITITKNSSYEEPGVMYRGEDVTEQLEIDDNINLNQNGYYEIQYRYRTSSGKQLQAKRTIVVTD